MCSCTQQIPRNISAPATTEPGSSSLAPSSYRLNGPWTVPHFLHRHSSHQPDAKTIGYKVKSELSLKKTTTTKNANHLCPKLYFDFIDSIAGWFFIFSSHLVLFLEHWHRHYKIIPVSRGEYSKVCPFIPLEAYYMQASSDVGFAPYLLALKMYKIRLLKCKDTDGPYGRELSRVL